MGKGMHDRRGGHLPEEICLGNASAGVLVRNRKAKAFAKKFRAREMRREYRTITAQALLDYEDEIEERRIFERELQEYDMLMADMYADEYDDYDLDLQREDDYHPMYESEYEPDYWPGDFDFDYPEPAPIAKPFVYERDIGSY